MAYDIYGNVLRPGYCEVHPDMPGQFPCGECERERRYYDDRERAEAHYRQQEQACYAPHSRPLHGSSG